MNIYCDDTFFENIGKGTPEAEACQKIINLVKTGGLQGWISSATKYAFATGSRLEHFRRLFDGFSEVPLRRSITNTMLTVADNPVAIMHVTSAKQFHIPYLVTVDKKSYELAAGVNVVNPIEMLRLSSENAGANPAVPFLDLKAQHHLIYNDIDDRFTDIIANTAFILGKYVDELENKFARAHNAKYCLGLSTGTDALHIAMLTLGIGLGDRVVVPANTFIATAEGVSLAGATPVFVDCDDYYNIDPAGFMAVIDADKRSGKVPVKAVIPVHLYGQPANMPAIMEIARKHNIYVVEDACQAHLARLNGRYVGSDGCLTAFSFYPGKNLGAYGEAGALLTNSEDLYNKAKMYRQHGEFKRYIHALAGHNYRMEAIQGAVLSVKMKHLPAWTDRRQERAQLYNEQLRDLPQVQTPRVMSGADHVYHLYVIRAQRRDELRDFMEKKAIATGLHYPVPLHFQEAYRDLGYQKGDLPRCEEWAGTILSLPMFPELPDDDVAYVCSAIREFYSR